MSLRTIFSPKTKPIPAGTRQLTINVPEEVHAEITKEAHEDDLGMGDHVLVTYLAGKVVANDHAAATKISEMLVRARPNKARLFGAGILGWINPRNIWRQCGKAVGL